MRESVATTSIPVSNQLHNLLTRSWPVESEDRRYILLFAVPNGSMAEVQ